MCGIKSELMETIDGVFQWLEDGGNEEMLVKRYKLSSYEMINIQYSDYG